MQTTLKVADLSQNRPTSFSISPAAEARAGLIRDMELLDLQKLRFEGEIRGSGKRDWLLTGKLGATVVQPCVATLAPVKTRIDQPVERLFLAHFAQSDEPEVEMPEDDRVEPLGAEIDLMVILAEALSLALPAYPRADGDVVGLQITEPGKEALTDNDVKPFASLQALRDQMKGE